MLDRICNHLKKMHFHWNSFNKNSKKSKSWFYDILFWFIECENLFLSVGYTFYPTYRNICIQILIYKKWQLLRECPLYQDINLNTFKLHFWLFFLTIFAGIFIGKFLLSHLALTDQHNSVLINLSVGCSQSLFNLKN